MPVIEVEELTVSYGPVLAVDHLSFTADAGCVLAVLGRNGAGKTSTVEVLEGYRPPSGGRVRVLGLDPTSQHQELVPRIGVMLQSGGVHAGIKVLEALTHQAGFYRSPLDPGRLLERLGLTHVAKSPWRQLSGGEQQRLGMALALVGRPQVVFLDEPTANVDVQGRQLIRRLVRELAHEGACVLVTTHDLAEAERVADQVVIIDRGRLVTSGTPTQLMATSGSREILFSAPPGLDVAGLGKAMMAAVGEVSPGEYRVQAEPSPAAVSTLTSWLAEHDLPLADLRAGRQSLEDVFLRLTEITGEVPTVRLEREAARADGRARHGRRRPGRTGAA